MFTPREKLVAKAEKYRHKVANRWKRRALREVKKSVKRNAKKGHTCICVYINMNSVAAEEQDWAEVGIREAIPIIKRKGYDVDHHQRFITNVKGKQYIIGISLLEKVELKES
ncbi:hypothetical protein LD13_gp086 [Bacillus phage Bobb]|uniref:Uncharacterized protein n=1 Tax=Bacillus phage Bobb TaxID=1527469 RepID=A0A076G6S3_9CAUD|nr:hypothetical protein LD13_gp086 [Bacillus phage Bobb]AII27987.1 hypothetical protein [Bacillus phage Bobb]